MSEFGTFFRGKSLQKKDFAEYGIPCIHYGQLYTHYGTFAYTTKSFVSEDFGKGKDNAQTGDVVIATTSENVEDVAKCVAWLGDDNIMVSNDACYFRHNQNPKYIAYSLQTLRFLDFKKQNVTGTKVIRISPDKMGNYEIPLPSLERQQEIVDVLDAFESLTTSLQSGLPAEIALRRQQYEYYRNKLLTFKRAS